MRKEWDDIDQDTLRRLDQELDAASEMTPDQIREMMGVNAKGNVSQSISNFTLALRGDPRLKGLIRYNEFTERMEVSEKAFWYRDSPAFTDTDLAYIRQYLEDTYGLNSEKSLDSALRIAANEHLYHPVREYLESMQWDGKPRIRFLLHRFLGADTSDLTYMIMKTFLIGAIMRVFHKGCKFEYMLCLVGGQGIGKSSFFRLLAVKDDDIAAVEAVDGVGHHTAHFLKHVGEFLRRLDRTARIHAEQIFRNVAAVVCHALQVADHAHVRGDSPHIRPHRGLLNHNVNAPLLQVCLGGIDGVIMRHNLAAQLRIAAVKSLDRLLDLQLHLTPHRVNIFVEAVEFPQKFCSGCHFLPLPLSLNHQPNLPVM